MAEEILQRESCDYCLYVITPKMTGTYSIAEAVDDSNKRPEKTIFCVLKKDGISFDKHQMKSLGQVAKLVKKNGGVVCESLEDVAKYVEGK